MWDLISCALGIAVKAALGKDINILYTLRQFTFISLRMTSRRPVRMQQSTLSISGHLCSGQFRAAVL
jgi:hypothetical protein